MVEQVHLRSRTHIPGMTPLLKPFLRSRPNSGISQSLYAGDFQAEPLSYSSVAQSIHFAKWEDPFVSFDAEGLPKRQLTFSADRSFCGQEGCSCIDTILINLVTVLLSLNQKRLNLLKRSIALGESNVIGRKSS